MASYSDNDVRQRFESCRGSVDQRDLDLFASSCSDADLAHLKGLGSLATLDLSLTNVTDAGLAHLEAVPSVEELGLHDTKVTDAGLIHLRALRSLKTLHLGRTKVTDAGLVHLPKSLTTLGLDGTEVTDGGLAQLKALDSLTTLSLRGTAVTDAGMVHLKAIGCLRTLRLQGRKITDRGLIHLRSMDSLTDLYLPDTMVTDGGLIHLTSLRGLDTLILKGTKVTDVGLIHLKGLHSLAVLDLSRTRVMGAGLVHLRGLQSLKSLGLSKTHMSSASPLIDLLEDLLPKTSPTGKARGGSLAHVNVRGNTKLGLDDRQLHETDALNLYLYLRAVHEVGRCPLHEIKVVMIGEGAVGKSCLLDRLMRRQPPPARDRTHDFAVEKLVLKVPRPNGKVPVTFRFFDFGGQPALHAAHRLFLSGSRNIYLLVNRCGGATRRDSRIDYWTGLIAFHGDKAPALIVQSWCDRAVGAEWKSVIEHNLGHRNPRFVFPAKLLNGYYDGKSSDAGEIRDLLIRIASQMDYVFTTTYEPGFFTLKRWLEQDPTTLPDKPEFARHCSVDQFRDNCKAAGITDPARQNLLLQIFGDLGRVIYVGELPGVKTSAGHALKQWIMNPQWIKGPVYQVIRDMPLAATHGQASHSDILARMSSRCPDLSNNEVDNLIALMEACGLIFPMKDSRGSVEGYLVVDQLPASDAAAIGTEAQEGWGKEEAFLCDFVGEDLLPRLIGLWRKRLLGLTTYTFRDRVVFTHRSAKDVHALVKADVIDSRICIRTRGGPQSGQKQAELRAEIEHEIRKLIDQGGLVMGERGASQASTSEIRQPPMQKTCFEAYRWAEEHIEDFDRLKTWEAKFDRIKEEIVSPDCLPANAETFRRHCSAAGIHLRQRRAPAGGRNVVKLSDI